MKKLRIFVSSVQKELEIERVAVAGWVSADSHLSEFCEVVLFEKEPLSFPRIYRRSNLSVIYRRFLEIYRKNGNLLAVKSSNVGDQQSSRALCLRADFNATPPQSFM